jgi:DNA invertase Pin-like site-specific DNA recombinase
MLFHVVIVFSVRLVAYMRVSTDHQAERGLGLPVQDRAIRRWCGDNGHRLITIYSEAGVSGTREAADRPALGEALEAVERRLAAGIVVYRLDRLARLLTVQEAALAQVWSHGGRCFTVDGGEILRDDPDDPMRTAMRQMIGVFSQLEKGMIAARMRAGRRLKAERGGYAGGQPPYGYRAERGWLVAQIDESAAIALASQLRRKGASLRAIAAHLEAEGFGRRSGATRWHPVQVARMLARLS